LIRHTIFTSTRFISTHSRSRAKQGKS